MPSTIRPATTDDHTAISRIAAESAALHARALPDRFREASDAFPPERLREMIESDVSNLLIAERNGDIAGYAMMQVRDTWPHPFVRPRRFVLLDEIAVAAVHRRHGVGRALVEAVVAWAREQDASDIELNVYEFNEAAIAFYERTGFTALRRTMALPLDVPRSAVDES